MTAKAKWRSIAVPRTCAECKAKAVFSAEVFSSDTDDERAADRYLSTMSVPCPSCGARIQPVTEIPWTPRASD
jgi:hypothetical protein